MGSSLACIVMDGLIFLCWLWKLMEHNLSMPVLSQENGRCLITSQGTCSFSCMHLVVFFSAKQCAYQLSKCAREHMTGCHSTLFCLRQLLTRKLHRPASRWQACIHGLVVLLNSSFLHTDENRVLVTLACGAALAAIYSPAVLESVRSSEKLTRPLQNVVVIVCGGNGVDLNMMDYWKKNYDI